METSTCLMNTTETWFPCVSSFMPARNEVSLCRLFCIFSLSVDVEGISGCSAGSIHRVLPFSTCRPRHFFFSRDTYFLHDAVIYIDDTNYRMHFLPYLYHQVSPPFCDIANLQMWLLRCDQYLIVHHLTFPKTPIIVDYLLL